ncbi:hypothetical protein ZIOFF_059573 [Zingiber officinale]|uniref:Exonuclease 1 n=1 Tax=Zingiber officinale TaxID=94328 RepID=A0A8J5FKX4_ZINOF|nr:hypothetical protein ZIOFF_059573 [Zingiber officinale]
MGIQNLLRFLKPFIRPVHIKKYAGKRVGIDAYSWLHKGAYSCSMQLCLDMSGDVANRYLSYFMHHINLLRHHQITPVVVFDGGKIPCKSATEHERQRQLVPCRRKANLEMAKKKLKEGNAADAAEFFRLSYEDCVKYWFAESSVELGCHTVGISKIANLEADVDEIQSSLVEEMTQICKDNDDDLTIVVTDALVDFQVNKHNPNTPSSSKSKNNQKDKKGEWKKDGLDKQKIEVISALSLEKALKRGKETYLAASIEIKFDKKVELPIKAIHVTPSMAYKLIQKLRSESIEFVVAPYEADAQLAYLSSREPDQGGIAAIITEDSDLIAYGCQAIVFKMDRYGYGEEIIMDRLFDTDSDELSFKDFDKELLTGMCVLAGCDFLPSIPGIGIKRAYSLVAKYKNLDRWAVGAACRVLCKDWQMDHPVSVVHFGTYTIWLNFSYMPLGFGFNCKNVLSVLKLEKRYKMPEHYCDSFRKAVAVFQHARVYDAVTRALTHLKPLDGEHLELLTGDLDLLGPELQRSVAAAIAEGKLNPITLQEFDYLPEVEACSGSASTPCFNSIPTDELKIPFEEDSCIMLLSQPADEEDIELITRVAQLDPMYIKEAVALSKLVAPKECQRVQEIELSETSLVPDNNPFKRRKMEKSGPEKINFFMPESQRSMQSNPVTPQAEKDKIQKKPKVKTEKKQSLRNEKNGILKFFQRLLQ